MQLTRAADYAVRVMIHLAAVAPGTRASRADLAGAVDCPEQFLSKVLQSLTRAGLVTSHRGNTGGFELPATRRNSSMLDIVEAVEGPIRLNICLNGQNECGQVAWCPAFPVWNEAQRAMTAILRDATIDELARRGAATRSDQSVQLDETPWS